MNATSRVALVPLLLGACLALAGARGQSAAPAPPPASGPQEVTVVGVFVEQDTQQPMVVLQGKRDRRTFAMAIGPAEATGIALPLQHVTPPRPLTHDLFLTLFGRLNVKVSKVVITDLRDHTYFAVVHLTAAGAPMELDSRPSDAIALAVRAGAPVYAEDHVFDKAAKPPAGVDAPGQRI
jgi:bifunctional DNase/RNase